MRGTSQRIGKGFRNFQNIKLRRLYERNMNRKGIMKGNRKRKRKDSTEKKEKIIIKLKIKKGEYKIR